MKADRILLVSVAILITSCEWLVFADAAAAASLPKAAAAAQPLKTLDLRPPDLRSIPLTHPPLTAAPIGMDDSLDFVIVSAPQFPEMQPYSHAPPFGLGSLYWAFRNPTQAWRILLPEQPPST